MGTIANPSSVDDRLQPAGAKYFKRSMELFDCRFKFRDLAVAPYFRQSSSDKIDIQRARQLARRAVAVFAQRMENLVNGRNFTAGARFHLFTTINGRPWRSARILTMRASQGV